GNPVPEPVDRPGASPLGNRIAMIRLLAGDIAGLETMNEADLKAVDSRNPHNLFEAMREAIRDRGSENDELFQIVGEDALKKLVARRQLPGKNERRTLVVYPREDVPQNRDPSIKALETERKLVRLGVKIPNLSGSDLRALLRRGIEPGPDEIPASILTYIRREGLYGLPASPLTRELLAGFEPDGYLAKPVLLHGPTTDTVFAPAHLESMLPPSAAEGWIREGCSDFPAALAPLLEKRAMQVVLFQAPTTDALDWLETQGWRTLYGYVPPEGDDRPMLFFGRQESAWYLFVTGLYAQDRFAGLVEEMRYQFARFQIPSDRLTVLVPVQPAPACAGADEPRRTD
ncbi:hypothetical protein KBA41_09570, partial [Candidatus Ozemobacteraceae bacterium]|nr:hypothetical protein [Candidatus Ozemobacteraceae bacterium]